MIQFTMNNDRRDYYHQQVELLLKVLPYVAKESCFALKGGTAINFFIRDMPRLSVDIDLTYLPLEPRDLTLIRIEEALMRIKYAISKIIMKFLSEKSEFRIMLV